MCGICGCVSWKDDQLGTKQETLVNRMTAKLTHRGPDDQNIWSSSNNVCTFGHSRLIVVDPEGISSDKIFCQKKKQDKTIGSSRWKTTDETH